MDALTVLSGAIQAQLAQNGRALVALDGMSASGKTSLAARLQAAFPCNVYHMDDFFLPVSLRAPNWRAQPGANMDFARLDGDVLSNIRAGRPFTYRPFRCKEGGYGAKISVTPRPLELVEGAYCMHRALPDMWTLRAFMRVDAAVQRARIEKRNGPDGLSHFEQTWIPLEAAYFLSHEVERRCQLVLED